jgi:hypothetical protein
LCLLLQIVSRSQYRGRIEDQLKEGIKEIKRIERRNDIPESTFRNPFQIMYPGIPLEE